MCDILEQSLKRRSHPNLLKAMAGVVMDPLGRCVCQHELDTVGTMTLPKSTWGEVRVRALVTALVHVLSTVIKLGVKEVQWLRHDYPAVGCVLPYRKHTIFIKAMNVLHPLDVVGTTIHEMAHHMVSRCGHHHESGDKHCKSWEDAAKYLTVLLRVSEIWMPLFFQLPALMYTYMCVCSQTENYSQLCILFAGSEGEAIYEDLAHPNPTFWRPWGRMGKQNHTWSKHVHPLPCILVLQGTRKVAQPGAPVSRV